MKTPRLPYSLGSICIPRLLLPVCLILGLGVVPAPATTVVPPQFDKLVAQADYIVRAVVTSVTSEFQTRGSHQVIITKVALDVRQVISGSPPDPLVLVMLGGRVGNEEMTVEGAPKFKVGEEDILFVHGNGRQFTPLVAMQYGRFRIKREGVGGPEIVTRSNGTPLTSEQQVAQPMGTVLAEKASAAQALSPAGFVSRIKAAIARNAARKTQQP